ncbi:FtsK/SpoIIIE domain-containing protein [Nocardioides convexus]|uniref:FtsK/SpoIIIE domain-containing protein n=1 Tax=Nocardioides convexus TaxID=2712224 RepID=UPI00241859EC|nr:FtsK/SpoIIIE domain-containing protein [Nocardioides convexus]
MRGVARDAADQQRRALTWIHPDPAALPSLAEDRSRVWERSSADPAFLQVRYGVCAQPLALEPGPARGRPHRRRGPGVGLGAAPAPRRPPAPARPARIHRPARLRPDRGLRRRGGGPLHGAGAALLRHGLPVAGEPAGRGARDRRHAGPLGLGEVAAARPQPAPERRRRPGPDGDDLAHRPRPDAAAGPQRATPLRRRRAARDPAHRAHHRRGRVAPGQPRDPARRPARRHRDRPPGALGRDSTARPPCAWSLADRAPGEPESSGVPLLAVRLRTEALRAKGDQCSIASAEALARRLTPLFTPSAGAAVGDDAVDITAPTDFMDLLGLGDVFTFDPGAAWRSRPARDRLRVPIGVGDGAGPIHLDIKESAQQGMGPHGLVIGATGSGKSEFLRTLVLGLAMTHSPEQTQHGPRRLQGRRDLRGDVRHAARLGGDHQPVAGA